MKHDAHMVCYGGWGVPAPPPFAYELTSGATYRNYLDSHRRMYGDPTAGSFGAIRLGAKPSRGDDTRPIVPGYTLSPNDSMGNTLSWQVVGVTTDLEAYPAPFGRGAGIGYPRNVINEPARVRSRNAWIPAGQAHFVRAKLNKKRKDQDNQLWAYTWGGPGSGYTFQIREGRPEIARLSREWNESDENSLYALWAVENPNGAQQQQIADLKAKLYEDFESLSFERKLGRDADTYFDQEFTFVFIPEPRGVLHIVLEGADASAHEWKAQLKHFDYYSEGADLWGGSRSTFYTAGGAFYFQVGNVVWNRIARLSFGPFRHGYWDDELDQLVFDSNALTREDDTATISFERQEVTDKSSVFVATIETDTLNPVWLYGLSARIPPGPRSGNTAVTFDSEHLYEPVNPAAPRETGNPILDINPSWDSQTRSRQLQVQMRDVSGTVSTSFGIATAETPGDGGLAGIYGAIGRVTTISVNSAAYLTKGLIIDVRQPGMGTMTPNVSPIFNARPETQLIFTVADGAYILSQMEAEVAVIGDGHAPGYVIRELLRMGGYANSEMTLVSENAGNVIKEAMGAERWKFTTERGAKIWDCIQRVLELYLPGWVLYQNDSGVWVLEKPSTAIVASFSSAASTNTPTTTAGRRTILSDLDWYMNFADFYNAFRVVGGEDGKEIVRESVIEESIHNPTSPYYIGFKKPYPEVRLPGARTPDEVVYALRCLRARHGKPGRRFLHPTYFDRSIRLGQRYSHDGRTVEVEAITGGSLADDLMQLALREVV